MEELIRAPDGLYGVAVTETRVSKSSADGTLTYRGYPIRELFEKASFEECAFLILEGRLPSRAELDGFLDTLRSRAAVPENVYDVVRSLPADAHPMDVLRTAVSALGASEMSLAPRDQQYSLIAKMPALAANCYRLVRGMPAIAPDPGLDQAGNLLYMLSGERPARFDSWAFERELILYLEHDLNASTFTVRVVASTLADVYAASTAGLAALKGPLHGGANEAAMQMLLEIGSPEKAEGYVRDALSKGKKVMGFGHRIYKTVDPR
jgi:citrate synthase